MGPRTHWEKIGKKPHHGISVPLFSVRTEKNCGIGEFLDLLLLIEGCKKMGMDLLQLLPLLDTGSEASPYSALSSCALDPIYLSLYPLCPNYEKEFVLEKMAPRLDRESIRKKKETLLYAYFEEAFPSIQHSTPFLSFLQTHQKWLSSYAKFRALKRRFSQTHHQMWPKEEKPDDALQKDIDFYTLLQFLCFSQMEEVKRYAENLGIFLKGDFPILVGEDSADVWENPSIFSKALVAGVPPDAFHWQGQKWGFPLLERETKRTECLAWYGRRLEALTPLFHLYRIDHVVGLFRIWGILREKRALDGAFFPSDTLLWEEMGREALSFFLDTSPLLPIAEDLGIIPREVPPVLEELEICSTKILRWQRTKEEGEAYLPFSSYNPLSLSTVSTHDLDTVSVWWKKFPKEAIPFAAFQHWAYRPVLERDHLFSILYATHHTSSYFHCNLLQEYLALFPDFVHKDLEEERINVPGTLSPKNWSYRYIPSLEELFSHENFLQTMHQIVGTLPKISPFGQNAKI